jgi:hypothetical protein
VKFDLSEDKRDEKPAARKPATKEKRG